MLFSPRHVPDCSVRPRSDNLALPTRTGFSHRPSKASPIHVAAASSLSGAFESGAGKVGEVTARTSNYSGASESTTAGPKASQATIKEAQDSARLFLNGELSRLFDTGKLTKEKYARDFSFQDPISKYSGIDVFQTYLTAMLAIFKVDFTVHSTAISGDAEITTRWTMELLPRLTPWVQKLTFTGRSFYTIDVLSSGTITAQRDVWDAVQDNSFPSLEAIAHVLQQITNTQTAPKLDSPRYVVLKRTKEYEVRQYSPYLAAAVAMPASSKPASGDGFNDLAAYIFGGNQSRTSMEMTTPVFTSAGQSKAGEMEFPIEEKMGSDPNSLPIPNSAKVSRVRKEGQLVAAASFGGWPLDFQVTEAERRLRGALLLDGLEAEDGYKLARYNDPFTPPFLRRNEVLIRLDGFELDPAS